jgi:outer membrane protein OmpA-like peptidoglycan-associated protein
MHNNSRASSTLAISQIGGQIYRSTAMSNFRKFAFPIVFLCLGTLTAFVWTGAKAQQQHLLTLSDQVHRMTNRLDLLSEVVEAASARAMRAEANAQSAATARDRAQKARQDAEAATAEARDQARLSAEDAQSAKKDAQAARKDAQASREEMERVRQERKAELDRLQQALGALVETRRTALGLVMNLGEDAIQFDFDKAELRPKHRELLSRIAGVLLTAKGYSIYVYGHTDDVGAESYNLNLSERRARAVRDYLVDAGVSADIISTRGYGKSSPRVAGTTDEARAKNRRVEVGIVDVSLDVVGPFN